MFINILFLLVLLVCNTVSGQSSIKVNTKSSITENFKSSIPLRQVEPDQQFKLPLDCKKWFIKRYVFDVKQYLYERYRDNKISKDSLAVSLKSLKGNANNQSIRKTKNAIYTFIGLKEDSSVNIIVDLNCNKSFLDDPVFFYSEKKTYPFKMQLEYVEKRKAYKIDYSLELVADFRISNFEKSVTNEFSLLIRSLNSKIGEFNVGSKKFMFELYSDNFRDLYDLNTVKVNFSEPNSSIKAIDFNKTLLYTAKEDSIISGDYQFVFKEINLFGDKAIIEYRKINKSKNGYTVGYSLPNLSLEVIKDSVTIATYIKEIAKGSKYVLLDFWGTWCVPCIKNFPKMREIERQFKGKGIQTIGIACEYKKDLLAVQRILSEQEISWLNVFVERNNPKIWDIADYMNVDSFPTYVLLDKDLKILLRESGADGVDKIVPFIERQLALQ